MASNLQRGFLVLADISGYTSYVAQTELAHAYEVLSELLELILGHVTPSLTLSKLEGDAVFAYAPVERLPNGESLIELVEATYVAFRDRVHSIVRRTTCECRACRAIPNLDLKFMIHCGHYAVQQVAAMTELVGSDVNLIHRLSKNRVTEQTGWRGYALFTESCLQEMGLRPEGLFEYVEFVDSLGQVPVCCLNLQQSYDALVADRRVRVLPEEADGMVSVHFPAASPLVWGWLNDPIKRSPPGENYAWWPGPRPAGRRGVGAVNHCAHGKNLAVRTTVLDWRPFDYYTEEYEMYQFHVRLLGTSVFERQPDGVTVHFYFKIVSRWPGLLKRLFMRLFVPDFKKSVEYVAEQVAVGAGQQVSSPDLASLQIRTAA